MWYTKENYETVQKVPQLATISGKSKNFRNWYVSHYNVIDVFLIYKGCNALKAQEMDSNQSGAVGWTIWLHLRGH